VRPLERRRDVGDARGVGQEADVSHHLRQRRRRRTHDGRALRHRLERWQAEALIEARIGEDTRLFQPSCPLARAEILREREARRVARAGDAFREAAQSPAVSARKDEIGKVRAAVPDRFHRRNEPEDVLARLERAHVEDIRPSLVRRRAACVGGLGLDPVVHDGRLFGGVGKCGDEVATRRV
jgi:hypothetical protein